MNKNQIISTGDIKDSEVTIAGGDITIGGKSPENEDQGLIKHLAKRFQTHWKRINEAKLRDWLIQFETTKRRQLALMLLERIDYVDDTKIIDMLTSFYSDLPEDGREMAVFVPFGSPGESSALITYLCSRALNLGGITRDRFQSLDTALASKEERPICFVDDNISSGTQAVAIFEELLGKRGESIHVKPLSKDKIERLKSCKIWFYTFFGFEEGDKFLKERLGQELSITTASSARKKEACFQPGSLIFDNAQEREEAKEMAREIGFQLLKDKPWPEDRKREFSLGYGNAQQLIVFQYNTPTCTLPIFWKEGRYKDKEWAPLFPRRE